MNDLYELSRPFPDKFVHKNPSGGGDYVKHHVVNQRLLTITGAFDQTIVQLIRGFVPGKAPNPNSTSERGKRGTPDLENAVVGAILRLTLVIDGKTVTIEEVGDCEEPHNWPHDGARAKDAVSDAFKRCAMRPGLGIHLWSQDEYFLDKQLLKAMQDQSATGRDDRKEDKPGASEAMPDAAAKPASTDDHDRQGGGSATAPPAATIGENEKRRLFALCTERGVPPERAERLLEIGKLLGRRLPLGSFNDITTDEYPTLIEALKQRDKVAKQPELAS